MNDIFISYSHRDKKRVAQLVSLLEKQNWSVWWDRKITFGKPFDDEIESELKAAKCILVVWSSTSKNSRWVKTEAAEGLKKRNLIPIMIDDIELPLEFRRIQTAKLIKWPAGKKDSVMRKLFNSIEALIIKSKGKKTKNPFSSERSYNSAKKKVKQESSNQKEFVKSGSGRLLTEAEPIKLFVGMNKPSTEILAWVMETLDQSGAKIAKWQMQSPGNYVFDLKVSPGLEHDSLTESLKALDGVNIIRIEQKLN